MGRSLSVPEVRNADTEDESSDGEQRESRKRKEVSPQAAVTKRRTFGEQTSEEDKGAAPEEIEPTTSSGDYRQKLDLLTIIGNDLARRESSQYKSKKVTLAQQKEVNSKVTELRDIVTSLRMEVSFMAGRLAERVSIENVISDESGLADAPRVPSFAEALKSKEPKVTKITGISRVQTPKVLFVRSTDEKKYLDEVKRVIKTSIRPSKLGVNIKRVIKTARGVLIENEGVEQLEKIKECTELKDKGLVFDKPKRRSPRLMIYDVDPPDEDDELIEDIYEQNVINSDIDLDIFKKEFKVFIGIRKGSLRTHG